MSNRMTAMQAYSNNLSLISSKSTGQTVERTKAKEININVFL